MLITIENMLTPDEVTQVRATLDGGSFVDGRHSTGLINDRLKTNEEFDRPGGKVADADRIIGQAQSRVRDEFMRQTLFERPPFQKLSTRR